MTDRFEGGVKELGAVEESTDIHQAVGRWWARAILQSSFNNGAEPGDEANAAAKNLATLTSLAQRPAVESRIGAFAQALEFLSREAEPDYISVDYHPDYILVEAACLAEMPVNDMTTFPWKTSTWIRDGAVFASLGYRGEARQVWPPVDSPQ